jgi:acetylglutamate kinase
MASPDDIAQALSGFAEPWRKYTGTSLVIRMHDRMIDDPEALDEFARDLLFLTHIGMKPVVVHGGGALLDRMLNAFGFSADPSSGKGPGDMTRVEVSEMVLSGHINKRIVQAINAVGGRAAGFSALDDRNIVCTGKETSFGPANSTVMASGRLIKSLCDSGIVPVVSPVAAADEGPIFCLEADTVAVNLASASGARRLLLLCDFPGLPGVDGTVQKELSMEDVRALAAKGVIRGEALAKAELALDAILRRVDFVTLADGRQPNAVLRALLVDPQSATEIQEIL